VPRPVFIADLTPSLVTAWRATWRFGDLTAANRWTIAKGFFNFCEAQGWVDDSPARKLKRLTFKKGSRTAIFTDEQYDAILAAVSEYEPDMISEATRESWQHRIMAFLELMRWSGMDLVDAVEFTPDLIGSDGVLRYRRQKTGILATIPLPERLIVLLRDVPPERDSLGSSHPFRRKKSSRTWDTQIWAQRLRTLFAMAGIESVQTDQRLRRPHTKMLRDTFAVWHLRHGAKLHTVAKMLGHSKTTTTERSYLPWVKELEEAHIADARKSLAQMPKPKDMNNVVAITSGR
jgi:integrase